MGSSDGSSGSLLSIRSSGSILSIGSSGSILSIGSAGSILSIGSVGCFGCFFSAFSVFSSTSLLSAISHRSIVAWRSSGKVGDLSRVRRIAPHQSNGHRQGASSRKWLPFSVHQHAD
jgi:hypothetical protein